MFDFDADGLPEVLFQDECHARVFAGSTGEVLFEAPSSSATIREYPVVADIDGDGRTEMLTTSNLSEAVPVMGCIAKVPGYEPTKGVVAWRAVDEGWATTGQVWTQHTHHITDADKAGNVPLVEPSPWSDGGSNSFRRAPHAEPITSAPDLTATLAVGLEQCAAKLVLRATMFNRGSLGVAEGVEVAFFAGVDDGGELLATVKTEVPLVPGGFTTVELAVADTGEPQSFRVVVDPADAVRECVEDNNEGRAVGAECPG